jgi:hypothetical protein
VSENAQVKKLVSCVLFVPSYVKGWRSTLTNVRKEVSALFKKDCTNIHKLGRVLALHSLSGGDNDDLSMKSIKSKAAANSQMATRTMFQTLHNTVGQQARSTSKNNRRKIQRLCR